MKTVDDGDIRITPAHMDHYREHGYAIVENFLSATELDGARRDIDAQRPGWIDYCRDPARGRPENWDQSVRSRFPFPGERLNAITVHPELRRMASELAGGAQLYCEQSDLNMKCKGHAADADRSGVNVSPEFCVADPISPPASTTPLF